MDSSTASNLRRYEEWRRIQPFGFFVLRKIARWCSGHKVKFIAHFIWRHQLEACDHCGKLVGMNSVISHKGFTCWPCHD